MIYWDDELVPLEQLHAEAEAINQWCIARQKQDYIDILEWWIKRQIALGATVE